MNFFPFCLAYFLGSIPFGLLITMVCLKIDIRTMGSGNIGTTNVLRTAPKKYAVLTLCLDVLKGALSVWLFPSPWVGLFAVLGHIFPIWLRFKGGKGVATALGVYLVLFPYIGVCLLFFWMVVSRITKQSSFSSLITLGLGSILGHIKGCPFFPDSVFFLILWTHRDNIRRLWEGTEHKIF